MKKKRKTPEGKPLWQVLGGPSGYDKSSDFILNGASVKLVWRVGVCREVHCNDDLRFLIGRTEMEARATMKLLGADELVFDPTTYAGAWNWVKTNT